VNHLIKGIGIDSIEISRVAQAIEGNPPLLQRLFTSRELAEAPRGAKKFSRLAAIFAGKEAVFKALGTGLAGHSWQQVEILHEESGAPRVFLHGQAEGTAVAKGIVCIQITLSHDKERALAFCVGEGKE